MPLWIKVECNRRLLSYAQCSRHVQTSGRFTDSAFLIKYGDDHHLLSIQINYSRKLHMPNYKAYRAIKF